MQHYPPFMKYYSPCMKRMKSLIHFQIHYATFNLSLKTSYTLVDSKNQNKVNGSAVTIQLAPRIYSPDRTTIGRSGCECGSKSLLITLLVILLSTCERSPAYRRLQYCNMCLRERLEWNTKCIFDKNGSKKI